MHLKPGLTAEQQALAVENLANARAFARVYAKRVPRLQDDIYAAANLGLVKAAARYQPGKSKFTSYLWRWIQAEVGMLFNAEFLTRWRKTRIKWESNNAIDWHIDERQAQQLQEIDDLNAFEARISNLNETQKALLRARFVEGKRQEDLAAGLGRSRCDLARISAAALRDIKTQTQGV